MKRILYIAITFLLPWMMSGCDMLDIKPVNSMLPESIEDFESVLLGGYPKKEFFMKTELMTDNIYANLASNESVSSDLVPFYTWAPTHQTANNDQDAYWGELYKSVYYANTVLDEFKTRTPQAEEKELYDIVKGEAYALRAYAYFYLINLYADVYAAENLEKPGVPMPLTAEDVNVNAHNNVREPVGKVWEQIVKDLDEAATLLKGKPAKNKFRFDYNCVQLVKARAHLFMGDYESSAKAAGEVISAKVLANLNAIQPMIDAAVRKDLLFSGTTGFINTVYQNEILFFTGGKANNNIYYYPYYVFKPSPDFWALFDENDYRRYIFTSWVNTETSDGQKTGPTVYYMYARQTSLSYYIGLKLGEAYVIRAEAYARMGNKKQEALNDLNTLRQNRIRNYTSLELSDFQTDASLLDEVLLERRLETAFDGGLRWFDLRRLGKPAQTHNYRNNEEYELKQGDLRYVLQIPVSEQDNSPEMPVNPR